MVRASSRVLAGREHRHYLKLLRKGIKIPDIALRCNTSQSTVRRGIDRARMEERPATPPEPKGPKLTPMFGSSVKALATLTCADVHKGPIPKGTRCCCMVCHRSGFDHVYGAPRPSVKRPVAKLSAEPKATKPKRPRGAKRDPR